MIKALALARDIIRINYCLTNVKCGKCLYEYDCTDTVQNKLINEQIQRRIDNYCVNHCNFNCNFNDGDFCKANDYFIRYEITRKKYYK